MSAQVCADCTAAYSIGAPQCPQCGANNPRPIGEEQPPPATNVRCPGLECAAYGVVRRVPLRLAAPGVVERPPLHCVVCDRAMETVHDDEQEGDGMPKVTKEGGPSIEGTEETNVELANGDLVHLDADEPAEGGEQSSPTPEADGTTSPTSSKKEQTSPETSETEAPSPAPKTGSRSAKGRTGTSTARGTGGDRTAPTSDTDKG